MSDRLEANNGVLAVVRLVPQRKVVSAFALRISAVNFDTGIRVTEVVLKGVVEIFKESIELSIDDLFRAPGLGGDDALWVEGSTLCDGSGRNAFSVAAEAGGRDLGRGNVDVVQLVPGGGVDGVGLIWIV
jgi:hypothetical protein